MEKTKPQKVSYILAITGASGALYAKTLLEYFYRKRLPLQCLISKIGERVWSWEIGKPIADMLPAEIPLYTEDDWWAPIASGSVRTKTMVIMPCSMGTLAAIAQGLAQNIIHRTADVMLKEKRPLILVPRETPLNTIHLENMLRLTKAGATILPATPGFYHRPQKIEDLINFIIARILDHLGIAHNLIQTWEKIKKK
jgi:4-hydroxy-3-polyprenylbenzoate decarboxylase